MVRTEMKIIDKILRRILAPYLRDMETTLRIDFTIEMRRIGNAILELQGAASRNHQEISRLENKISESSLRVMKMENHLLRSDTPKPHEFGNRIRR